MITQFCPLVKDYFQNRHFFKLLQSEKSKAADGGF